MRGSDQEWLVRHRYRRASRTAALVASLALVLAACGGGEDEPSGASGDASGVTVTAWFNGETVPTDRFAALEAQGITVEWDIRGDTILTDMLRMRDAGEQLPDLVEIDSNLTPAFLEAQLLAPMTEPIARWEQEDPDLYGTIPASVWEDGTYDGEIMHVPNKSLVDALYYNINILEQAGVDPPPYDSYDDLLEAMRTIKQANPDLPAYFATGGTSPDRVYRWLIAFGVPFGGEEQNVPELTSPQGLAMIEWLQTMHAEGLTNPEFVIGENDEAPGAFASGELPFMEEGINNGVGFMGLDDFVYGQDWATAPYPVHEEDGGDFFGVPRGWSMSADAENPEAAIEVVKYLMSPEIAEERYLRLESGVVQSLPVLEGDALKEAQPFFTDELLDIFRNLDKQIPPGTTTAQVAEILGTLKEELSVTGTDESPEAVAERYQQQLEEIG